MSRREKVRENTREEIKEIARHHMVVNGAATLSLNAIARDMEMSTPALYRYYANRDDLITALLVDAQASMSESILAAASTYPANDVINRLYIACLNYREWAIAHPIEYQLLFGNPIAEYECPPELIVATGITVFGIFLDLLQAAHEQGLLHTRPHIVNLPSGLKVEIPAPPEGPVYAPVVAYIGIVGWAKMHGLIMLEMLHHFNGLVNDPALYYQNEIQAMLTDTGLAPTKP